MLNDNVIPSYKKKFRTLLIFGPPGSGKGTLGRFLSAAGGHVHLSSGDIFRGLSPDSPAGQLFHKYASLGHLVPDDVTLSIWKNYVLGLIATNKYFPSQQYLLLDGLPRTLKQAELLDQEIEVTKIIVLKMENTQKLMERMKRRAIIEGRKDDMDEKVLRTRFEVYEKDTVKLLSHYPKNLLCEFNADQKPLEVLKDVLCSLSDVLSQSDTPAT